MACVTEFGCSEKVCFEVTSSSAYIGARALIRLVLLLVYKQPAWVILPEEQHVGIHCLRSYNNTLPKFTILSLGHDFTSHNLR